MSTEGSPGPDQPPSVSERYFLWPHWAGGQAQGPGTTPVQAKGLSEPMLEPGRPGRAEGRTACLGLSWRQQETMPPQGQWQSQTTR